MGGHHSHEQTDGEGTSGFSTPRAGSRRGSAPRGSSGEIEKPERSQPTSMVPVEKLGKVRKVTDKDVTKTNSDESLPAIKLFWFDVATILASA